MRYIVGIKNAQEHGICPHCTSRRRRLVFTVDLPAGGNQLIEDTLCLKHLNNLLRNFAEHPIGRVMVSVAKAKANDEEIPF